MTDSPTFRTVADRGLIAHAREGALGPRATKTSDAEIFSRFIEQLSDEGTVLRIETPMMSCSTYGMDAKRAILAAISALEAERGKVAQAVADERERCARICDAAAKDWAQARTAAKNHGRELADANASGRTVQAMVLASAIRAPASGEAE